MKVCSFSVLNIKEYLKIRDKVKDLYKKNDITKNCSIKFLNSLIYFEKFFSYNDLNIKNSYEINKEKDKKDSEAIIVDEEKLFLKENEKIGENNSEKMNDNETRIVDIISEKIFKNYKGKINIDDIKENISYFINIDKKINFDAIIQLLYEKKYNFVDV